MLYLYTFADPLSEGRPEGDENDMQREETEILRGRGAELHTTSFSNPTWPVPPFTTVTKTTTPSSTTTSSSSTPTWPVPPFTTVTKTTTPSSTTTSSSSTPTWPVRPFTT